MKATAPPIATSPSSATALRWPVVVAALVIMLVVGASIAHKLTRDGTLAWAEAYAEVLAQVRSDATVTSKLGSPLSVVGEPSFEKIAEGAATLSFAVQGPAGGAEVHAALVSDGPTWKLDQSSVKIAGSPDLITFTGARRKAVKPPALAQASGPFSSAGPATPHAVVLPTPVPEETATHKELIGVIPGVIRYDKEEITVKAGEKVAILFVNKACPLQHNLIILKPGTDAAFGAAADAMMQDDAATALAKHYVPDDATSKAAIVAATTKLIGTGQSETLEFTAPAQPGVYPYLCTFPGHRFLMKGKMTVVP